MIIPLSYAWFQNFGQKFIYAHARCLIGMLAFKNNNIFYCVKFCTHIEFDQLIMKYN